MIPYIDIALLQKLGAALPNIPISWMPADQGIRSAYVRNDNDGKSAMTLFRKTTNLKNINLPMGQTGVTTYNYSSENKLVQQQKRVPVDVEYEFAVWSYTQSDMNNIQRALMFYPLYNPVTFEYGGLTYQFYTQVETPKPGYDKKDDAETIRVYSLKINFTVLDAFWIEEPLVKTVKTIFADFYDEVTNGNPVMSDQLQIIPNLV